MTALKLGTYRLFQNLEPECKAYRQESIQYNESDKLFIPDKINKLLNEGVIEPSFSPWRAQVLVAKVERHKRQMLNDCFQIVNRFTLLNAYPLPIIDEQISAIAKGTIFSTLDLKSASYQTLLCPEDRHFTAFQAFEADDTNTLVYLSV